MHLKHAFEGETGIGFDIVADLDRFYILIIFQTVSQIIKCRAVHIGADRTGLAGQPEYFLIGIFLRQAVD